MPEEIQPKYLEVRNWGRHQLKLKNGRERRDWFRHDSNRADDPDFCSLTMFERGVLDSIMEYTARSGRWAPNDVTFISHAIHAHPTDRPHLHHALLTLISRRFLVLCNQQKVEEFALQDKTGHDKTRQMIIAPRAAPQPRFIPPSLEYIKTYMETLEMDSQEEAQAFFDHHSARNWVPSGQRNQMRDWKAAVRTWKRNQTKFSRRNGNGKVTITENEERLLREYEERLTREGQSAPNLLGR